jgi:hypothetical protein
MISRWGRDSEAATGLGVSSWRTHSAVRVSLRRVQPSDPGNSGPGPDEPPGVRVSSSGLPVPARTVSMVLLRLGGRPAGPSGSRAAAPGQACCHGPSESGPGAHIIRVVPCAPPARPSHNRPARLGLAGPVRSTKPPPDHPVPKPR